MALARWLPRIEWPRPPLRTKANPVTRAIVALVGGMRAVWTPLDYEKLAREGYKGQITLNACVNLIAGAGATIPLLMFERSRTRGGSPQEITQHELLDALNRPNDEQGGTSFRIATLSYPLISGQNYINPVGPDNKPPRELWLLRPDRMQVIPDASNRVGGYWYARGRPGQKEFAREEIIHTKLFDPIGDWYGQSPLFIAAKAVDASNAAMDWNVSLLQNHAQPAGALVAKTGLEDSQFERLKTQIEERISGPQNAGRPLLLEGDMSWTQFSLTAREMDWLKGIQEADRMICRVYHVGPELVGLGQATYANRSEAQRALYEDAVIPLLQLVLEDWNNQLVPRWGNDRLYLAMNLDAVPALRQNQDALWTRVEGNHSLSLWEKREALGYGPVVGFDAITLANDMVIELDTEAQARTGKPTMKRVWIPPTLLPMDEPLPELPDDDEDEGKILPLPTRALGAG